MASAGPDDGTNGLLPAGQIRRRMGGILEAAMRRILPGLFLALDIVSCATLQSQVQARGADPNQDVNLRITQPSPQIVRHAETLNSRLQPTARVWVLQQAKDEAQRPTPDLDTLTAVIRQRLASSPASSNLPGTTGGFAQQDVETLA